MKFVMALLMLPGLAFGACPAGIDRSDDQALLLETLAAAPDEVTADLASKALWEIWLTAPDEIAQDLLDRGMERREAYDFEASETLLDELVTYCPNYAEGLNQRAFTRFLRNDLDGSLEDIDVVLRTQPDHFGALSGKAMILFSQGRALLGQKTLRRAVAVHPWLSERSMVTEIVPQQP